MKSIMLLFSLFFISCSSGKIKEPVEIFGANAAYETTTGSDCMCIGETYNDSVFTKSIKSIDISVGCCYDSFGRPIRNCNLCDGLEITSISSMGKQNISIGKSALFDTTTGTSSIAFGVSSLDTIPSKKESADTITIGLIRGSGKYMVMGTKAASWPSLLQEDISPVSDFGTWEPLPEFFTEWVNIDTLGAVVDANRIWVYEEEKLMLSFITNAVYSPCGTGSDTRYKQRRICSNTGILQERYRIVSYKYIEKPKTDFEKAIESFKK